jgi:hypothetical protein
VSTTNDENEEKKEAHILPTGGPVAGPRKEGAMNTLVAMPRFTGPHISAITPMPLVTGDRRNAEETGEKLPHEQGRHVVCVNLTDMEQRTMGK